MCWEVLEAPRSPRRCSALSATCQSAGRAARALFSSGMFCTSQPSCFIRLLELLQAAGKMSSPGCFLSRTERVPSVQLPAGCSPRLTPYQEGTRRQFPSRLLDFCLQQPQGLPLEVWGWLFHRRVVALPCHTALGLLQAGLWRCFMCTVTVLHIKVGFIWLSSWRWARLSAC